MEDIWGKMIVKLGPVEAGCYEMDVAKLKVELERQKALVDELIKFNDSRLLEYRKSEIRYLEACKLKDAEIEQIKAENLRLKDDLAAASSEQCDSSVYQAEIEQLKAENGALLFTYQQLEKEWYEQQKLITELTDAVHGYLSSDGSYGVFDAIKLPVSRVQLIATFQRVREATTK